MCYVQWWDGLRRASARVRGIQCFLNNKQALSSNWKDFGITVCVAVCVHAWYTFISTLAGWLAVVRCSSDLWFLFLCCLACMYFISVYSFDLQTVCQSVDCYSYWMDIFVVCRCRHRFFALSIRAKYLFVNVSNDYDSSVRPLVWRHAIAKGHFICGAQTVKKHTYFCAWLLVAKGA